MRFLVDAQLPPALARWLVSAGHAAEHVSDRGLADAPDSTIWRLAMAEGLIIVTKDEDFAQRKALGQTGPAVIWIRLPNARRRVLLDAFAAALPELISELTRGETLIELA